MVELHRKFVNRWTDQNWSKLKVVIGESLWQENLRSSTSSMLSSIFWGFWGLIQYNTGGSDPRRYHMYQYSIILVWYHTNGFDTQH